MSIPPILKCIILTVPKPRKFPNLSMEFPLTLAFQVQTHPHICSPARERLARLRSSLDLEIVRKFVCKKTGEVKVVIWLYYLGCGKETKCCPNVFYKTIQNTKDDDIFFWKNVLIAPTSDRVRTCLKPISTSGLDLFSITQYSYVRPC